MAPAMGVIENGMADVEQLGMELVQIKSCCCVDEEGEEEGEIADVFTEDEDDEDHEDEPDNVSLSTFL